MTKFSLVDVVNIKSKKTRSSFSEEHIEKLARSILESGGLLKPLILSQVDLESYEVISGDLEFFAAKRAREIDPRKGEMAGAFVFPKKVPESIETQLELLNSIFFAPFPPGMDDEEKIIDSQRFTNLETRLDRAIEDIKRSYSKEIQRLDLEMNEIKKNVPSKIEILEAFNGLSLQILARKLHAANIKGKTSEKIIGNIEKERNKNSFVSISDIVRRVDGLGDKRIISIIDALNGTY
jgi:ParB-like nuclease domain